MTGLMNPADFLVGSWYRHRFNDQAHVAAIPCPGPCYALLMVEDQTTVGGQALLLGIYSGPQVRQRLAELALSGAVQAAVCIDQPLTLEEGQAASPPTGVLPPPFDPWAPHIFHRDSHTSSGNLRRD